MPYPTTTANALIFLAIFILAFFPNQFIHLLRLPFSVLGPPIPTAPPHIPPACSSIASCLQYLRPTTSSGTSSPNPSPSPSSSSASTITTSLPSPSTTMSTSSWFQKTLTLPSRSRGSYLITDDVVAGLPELKSYRVGLLTLFIQHTSCALSLNENWDSDVRADMSDALDRIVPEDRKGGLYRHDAEGSDDMPAHIKSALIGASVTIPISNGRLATGTWQGIWYLEFRTHKHSRKVVATIQGEKA